jgi:voltage-gated potassium channel
MAQTDFTRLFGLAGVAEDENTTAKKVGTWLEWPMIVLALWILVEWNLQATQGPTRFATVTDWLVWGFFLLETIILTALVDQPGRHLRTNWINLIIIALGFPLIWWEIPEAGVLRTLRLIVLFNLLFQFSNTARKVLSKNHLGATLQIGFLMIVMSGFIVSLIDPSIETPWDGIWWAWVTVTTVGYGDIVPGSMIGRLFASFLILMGIGLFSMLTANFSALLVSEEEEKLDKQIMDKIDALEAKVDQLTELLEQQSDKDGNSKSKSELH